MTDNRSACRLANAINATLAATCSPSDRTRSVAEEFGVWVHEIRIFGVDIEDGLITIHLGHLPADKTNFWSYRDDEPWMSREDLASRIDGAICGLIESVEKETSE